MGPVLIADVTFHDQWHLFQVRHQSYSDCFASLGSHHSSLGNRTGDTITGFVAKFQNGFSKLCSVFCRFESVSLQQRRLRKNFNFGTATSCHGLNWFQTEIVQSPKMKL